MEVPLLTKEGHKVLNNEYCYGYTDKFGKWNNGFPCPKQSNGEPVYCCGTSTESYCCRKKNEEPQLPPPHDQTLLLGVALGTLLVVLILAVGACVLCRKRFLYKSRHQMNGGPLYRMHCSSSGANVYSFSGNESGAASPCIDGAISNTMGEMEPPPPPPRGLPSMEAFMVPCPGGGMHLTGPLPHMEPPPPYEAENPQATLNFGTIPITTQQHNMTNTLFNTATLENLHFAHQQSTTLPPNNRRQQHQRQHQHHSTNQQAQAHTNIRDPSYWSTKF
ncbi:protein shisa-4-like isoform X2 [Ornithodoros turicata]|uniref:protein shisa-4-like isoform X2 n=1 Tax=Ornithodoros turicata TaxID=34597 RepID=UPI003139B324